MNRCLVCDKPSGLEDYCDNHVPDSTTDDRERRKNLRCSLCRPNNGENKKCWRKHGVRKPRKKDKR